MARIGLVARIGSFIQQKALSNGSFVLRFHHYQQIMPLSFHLQRKLTKANKGKLCTSCHKQKRHLYLEWCSDCIYRFAIGE